MATRPPAPHPSWRPGLSSGGSSGSAPSPARRRWRRTEGGSTGRRGVGSGSSARIGWTLAAFIACSATYVWLCTWPMPPRPAALLLVGSGPGTDLEVPQGAHAWHSLERLASWARARSEIGPGWPPWRRSGMRLLGEGPVVLRPEDLEADSWSRILQDRIDQRQGERTLILYLTLAGASDRDGAYFLADGLGLGDDPARLRLDALIEFLSAGVRERRIPPTLLILDVVRFDSDWSLGVLSNDFVRHLKRLEGRIASVPDLVVLASADDGEWSLTSDETGSTRFGDSALRGLAGAADGRGGPADRRVDALELFSYLRQTVSSWAEERRGVSQRPILLPDGGIGFDRARSMELSIVVDESGDPIASGSSPSAGSSRASIDDLSRRWRRWDALRLGNGSRPPVSSIRPLLWARYQQALLRFEQLCRVSATVREGTESVIPDAVDTLARELDNLEGRLSSPSPSGESLRSWGVSIAMPEALGAPIPTPDPDQLDALARAIDPGDPAALRQVVSTTRGDREALLQAADRLVRQAEAVGIGGSITPEQLDPIASVASALDDRRGPPLPCELHLIAEIARGVDRSRGDRSTSLHRAMARAIGVRTLAERAALSLTDPGNGAGAPRPDRLWPWISTAIASADAHRRRGEDLLFSPRPADWDEAISMLDQARRLYQQGAITPADAVREALQVRDLVLPLLPWYTRWAAQIEGFAPDPVAGPPGTVALDQNLSDCWDASRALLDELDEPGSVKPDELRSRGKVLAASISDVESRFFQECESLLDDRSPTSSMRIEAALGVPFNDRSPDPSGRTLRMRLLERLRGGAMAASVSSTSPSSSTGSAGLEDPAVRAVEQARYALLGLRATAPDLPNRPEADRPETLLGSLEDLRSTRDRSRIAYLGDQIARNREGRIGAVERLVGEAFRIGSEAPGRLEPADRLSRMLDGAGAARLIDALPDEPALARHHRDLRELLVALAERSALDGWDDSGGQAPYFEREAHALLVDAEALGPNGGDSDRIARLRTALDPFDGKAPTITFEVQGGDRIVLTSEPTRLLSARPRWVLPEGESEPGLIPSGLIVSAFDPDGTTLSATDGGPVEDALELGPDPEDSGTLLGEFRHVALDREEPELRVGGGVEPGTVRIRARFRGRRIDQPIEVRSHVSPSILKAEPGRSGPSTLAVQASDGLFDRFGSGKGALAIVLDCSHSMHREGDPDGVDSLYREVLDALDLLLRRVPRGTSVSIWLFGHAEPGDREARPPELVEATGSWPGPDGSGRLILEWMGRLRSFRALGGSPIAETMLLAKAWHLDRAPRDGVRALVVVTDGMDTEFASDRRLNPDGRAVGEVLRERFDGSGIQVDVIGVEQSAEAEAGARSQFGFVEQLDPPGRFVTEADGASLAGRLRRAFEQRLDYRVLDASGALATVDGSEAMEVGRAGRPARWVEPPLPPGRYSIRMGIDGVPPRVVEAGPGDCLLLGLSSNSGVPGLSRLPMVDGPDRPSIRVDQAGWAAAVWQVGQPEGGPLELFSSIEPTADPPPGRPIRQGWPSTVWFEVVGGGSNASTTQPVPVSWSIRPGYPAPAWAIAVPGWDGSEPALRSWWSSDPESGRVAVVPCGPDSILRVGSRATTSVPLGSGGPTVTVHAPTVEEHEVEVEPGVRRPMSCLVVRVDFGDAPPTWARPEGLSPAGAEHRFFEVGDPGAPEGRYTGLFWPATQEAAASTVSRVILFSRDAFKADCRASSTGPTAVVFDRLGVPGLQGPPDPVLRLPSGSDLGDGPPADSPAPDVRPPDDLGGSPRSARNGEVSGGAGAVIVPIGRSSPDRRRGSGPSDPNRRRDRVERAEP